MLSITPTVFITLYIQTLHNDCSHIEDVYFPLINSFPLLTGVELRSFLLPR